MAQVFGEKSRYLIWNDYIGRAALFLMFFLLCYLIYSYFEINTGKNYSFGAVIVVAMLYLLLFKWILRSIDSSLIETLKFKRGRYGEYEVHNELEKLSDNFLVFQDVKLPGRRDNIDFVVLGPTGVFALEVKSHKGRISFDGKRLTRNGSVILGKDMLWQAMDEAMRLHEHLKNVIGKEFFVDPALVFSSDLTLVRFGFQKIRKVFVIGKRYLHEFVISRKEHLNHQEVEVLKSELMKLVQMSKE